MLGDASFGPSTYMPCLMLCSWNPNRNITQGLTRTSFTCLLSTFCRSALTRMSSTFLRLLNYYRPTAVRRFASAYAQPSRRKSLAWSSALAISAGLAFGTPYKIYLDSQATQVNVIEDTIGGYNSYYHQIILIVIY